MAGSGKKWLVGCGVGCGAAVLLSILLTVGGSLYIMQPFNKAVDARKALEAEYGTRETYIPPAEGISADRLEIFLAVRHDLLPMCEEFRKIGESFAAMDELDKGGDEPSKGEIFKAMGGLTGSIFGMVGNLGRFTELRNQALLGHGMSLGEYIWIYVLVYNSWQGEVPRRDFDEDAQGAMSSKEQKLLVGMVRRHAEALASAGMAAEATLWEEEADRMKRSETGVPFKDGTLPEKLIRVFEPYSGKLENLYCEATSSFEMNRIQKRGLSIHSD